MVKDRKGLFGFAGVICSSMCFLGFPVLMTLIPESWMGTIVFEWILRVMFFTFFYFSARTAYESLKQHHHKIPFLVSIASGITLVLLSFYLVPKWIGYLALAAFLISWFWNKKLLKNSEQMACHI